VAQIEASLGYPERRICRVLGQPRSTQRYSRAADVEEDHPRACIIDLASKYGRYGYRPITAILQAQGWAVGHTRVERIWHEKGLDVLEQITWLFILHGIPDHIRSDNGPEFVAENHREGLNHLGVSTLSIEPGSPWEDSLIESFNGKLRNQLLDGEITDTVLKGRVVTEHWRKEYNTVTPHISLGYRRPAPEALMPVQKVRNLDGNPTHSLAH